MKNDARYFLNQKRQKIPSARKVIRGGIDDARKILNSKLVKKKFYKNKFMTAGTSSNPIMYRSLSSHNNKRVFSQLKRTPRKDVKLTRDGNIYVTARSKNSVGNSFTDFSRTSLSTQKKNIPQWIPSNIDATDIEHIAISDVLDIDSLPSALVGSNNISREKLPLRSLAEEIIDMQDTMVADQVESPHKGAIIRVSNLHSSVSKQDILELFGDVGLIKSAEMIQPGIAEIEFYYASDAVKACELYHNRLLDGLPMQCFIRPQTQQRTLISQRLGERFQNSQINRNFPSTSANSRVMHNPRNVQFTVKLT